MNERITRYCIMCGNEYKVRTGMTRKSGKTIRNRNSRTCSRRCSRLYQLEMKKQNDKKQVEKCRLKQKMN